MEKILKKLDLDDILNKEMNFWCQKSTISLSDTNIDEINPSNTVSKISDNLLTNKISETIQNIRIKKQKDFYISQVVKKDKKQKQKFSPKASKVYTKLIKHNNTGQLCDDGSDNEEIFVSSLEKKNNIFLKSTPPSSSSIIFNNCPNKRKCVDLCTPSNSTLNTRNLARSKLNTFKYTKNSTIPNTSLDKSSILKSPQIQKRSCLSKNFLMEDEDDLSCLDID